MSSLIRTARQLILVTGLVVLIGLLTPIWFVHDRVTRLVSARREGGRVPIRRVPAATIEIDRMLATGEPVIVEGLADRLGIGDAATPSALLRRAGSEAITVAFHDDEHPYFLYSGGYGATVSERTTMSVAALLDVMDGGPPTGSVVYQLLGVRSAGGRISEELDVFDRALSAVSSHPTAPQFSGVWIGSRGVVTPLHHDAWPGILFQTHGRKRVAMYAPSDRCNLSFRSPLHGAGRWSDLPGRSADASPDEFPRLRHATRLEGELQPGDALFIPPFWAHEMEAVEANISVPFRFETFRRSHLDPGFLRPAAEMARARLSR